MRPARLARVARVLGALVASLAAGAGGGCEEHEELPPPIIEPNGLVIIDWTVDGAKDANLCALSSSASIAVRIVDNFGRPGATFEQDCTIFAMSVSLPAGTYAATANLISVTGQPRTTAVTIAPFDVLGNTTTTVPIDFPASSFFGIVLPRSSREERH